MGSVSRVHTFASAAVLTAAQLNNEFDNLLTSSAINGGLDATNLGVTAGQITASKAVVVDGSRNLDDGTASNQINNLVLSGTLTVAGATTQTGALSIDDNTDSTSTTTGSIHTDGGVGIALDLIVGNDVKLLTDSSVLSLGIGSDATLTHDGTTGLTIAANPVMVDSGDALTLDAHTGIVIFKDAGSEVLRFTEGNSGDVTIKLATNGKDLIFTDNGDATGLKVLDAAVGINVPGEVQTTKIAYTDGDDAITIADGGGVTTSGTLATTGAATLASLVCTAAGTFGGGYGATGATISTLGVLQANGAITSDGAVTGATLAGTVSTAAQNSITSASSLATVGTIGTGTWQGTALALAYGGTGLVDATDGKIVIADGSGAPVLLDVGSSTAITVLGTVATGTWQGIKVASAYLDDQTAHLNITQSFTGAKTFGAATQFNSTVTVGVNDTGYDVQLFGATAGSNILWDQSADDLIFTNAGIAVGSDATGDIYYRDASGFLARLAASTDGHVLTTGGAGTIPAFEALPSGGSFSGPGSSTDNAVVRFNGTGGATGQNSGLIVDDSNNVTGAANVTLSGELDAATGDFSGAVDIAGALTIGGTAMIANDTNHRITTATGSGTLDGEAGLTFNGSTLAVTGDTTISADLMIGLTSISTVGGVATYKSEIASSAGAQMLISEWGNDNVAGSLSFSKSRSASMAAARLTVNGGDDIGKVTFYADDGGGIENKVVEILAEMDNTSGAGDLPGRLTFWTATDGSTTLVERMRIDSAGKVGIGAAPATIFHVSGAFNNAGSPKITSTGTEAGLQLDANSTNGTLWQLLSVGASGGGGAGNFQLYNATDSSTALLISPAGRLTTTTAVAGNSAMTITHTASNTTHPFGLNVDFSAATPNNTTQWFYRAEDSTTLRYVVYSDGSVQGVANSYGAVSDVKLKQDITDVRSYWDDFKDVRFRKYKLKTDVEQHGDDAQSLFGVVAQEVESIFPSLVTESPDTKQQDVAVLDDDGNATYEQTQKLDDDGNTEKDDDGNIVMVNKLDDEGNPIPITESKLVDFGTTTKGFKYSILSQIGLKVVQELQTRLEAAEAKITALESA